MDNLVANALLHNEKGTTLTVTIQSAGPNDIALAFSDNGKGMNEETASRLFERYYRGTDTESRTEGSGLGMAVTKALVEALGEQSRSRPPRERDYDSPQVEIGTTIRP